MRSRFLVRRFGTASSEETKKFSRLMDDWWDPLKGPSVALHQLNPFRVGFIRQFVCSSLQIEGFRSNPLVGLDVLDVGCGGGILSESLTRLGGRVHGIDASEKAIEIAKRHGSKLQGLTYEVATTDELVARGFSYDLVICSEVLEHVPDYELLISDLAKLSNGKVGVVVSTINRTIAR